MTNRDLLIEIGTEELPPKALPSLSKEFCREVENGLKQHSLDFSSIEPFATPRRLAMIVRQLAPQQADSKIEKYGPAIQAAFDKDGSPTKAAEGFARSCGVDVSALEQKDDGKVVKLYFQSVKQGVETISLIPEIVISALAKLPIPKRMRWGSKRVEFVRPVHWVVLLYGEEPISSNIIGVESNQQTYGHRFHFPDAITLSSPDDYESQLEAPGHVIASFAKRREKISALLHEQAKTITAAVIIDPALLDEVTALVEWPVALLGKFDPAYLAVPQEALISSLKEHQKCFHLLNDAGDILPYFLTVSNICSRDPAQVIAGNEKVIGPRLADAAFFFTQDKKQTLDSRQQKLKTVVFQKQLGTLFDKSQRIQKLSSYIAAQTGADINLAERASQLGKCDLLTSMVSEFPDLQGIMGTYYARADGENEQVAAALNEQYQPRFSGDELPASDIGAVLALAERIDTIAGLFAIGQPPTGSKDPYALRRAALGIIRILVEQSSDLNLQDLITKSCELQPVQPESNKQLSTQIYDFFIDRMRAWYTDQNISADTFQAVEAIRPSSLKQFDLRLKAVHHFVTLPDTEALASANKRVANILAKVDNLPQQTVDTSLLTEAAEISLFDSLNAVNDKVIDSCTNQDYTSALKYLCTLRPEIDTFFTDVMVNAEDASIRLNRQLLLLKLHLLFKQVADISKLQISTS